ncbi:hypothetical protein NEF87_001689 [Candidatus Lokiarchaeum ossiferum]|uniref:NAD/GMP synthase domain-containing protein n=1 Tax=Candidatus Lokiarchaeum ossiferum TaxID=2951803 RepID=A0ABY6HSG2_9ARCH|nr:hypothetical protein NEF87_001689 [Candidatus Lokiarchaeum sp. B-35]
MVSSQLDRNKFTKDLWKKIDIIQAMFKDQKVIVAFSGGIDSTFLAFLAKEFAQKVLVVLIKAPTTPQQEFLQAQKFSKELSLTLEIIEVNTLAIPDIAQNSEARCYFCKQQILKILLTLAEQRQFDLVVDGTNFSDLSTTRAGLKALKETPVRSPLAEAELSKAEIIQISQILNLPSKDIPSQACLASRVPFNVPLTPQILAQIDQSEQFIRTLLKNDHSPLRVRLHVLHPTTNLLGRIECENEIHQQIIKRGFQQKIVSQLKKFGFTYVTIDLHGFKSGSMHEML